MESKSSITLLLFLFLFASCTDSNKDVPLDLDAMVPKGCSIKKLSDCTHSEFEKCKLDKPDCGSADPFLKKK